LRRPYVGYPDLDRPEALFTESLAVGAHAYCGRR
jgi:hypothetical protein